MVLLLNQTKLPFPEIAIFLAHLDLVMSTKFGKETRYIQYAAGEIDKITDSYCTTIVWYETSHSK